MLEREVVRLTGRVQGVGFRDRVIDIAESYDVAGTVRNIRRSESLEIDVEGEPGEVERFIAAVLANPPTFARVLQVERSAAVPLGLRGFGRAPDG